MAMTFEQFIAKQFIPFLDARAFKQWLGSLVDDKFAERWWLQLWQEFLEEQQASLTNEAK
jgi:hypothetical protein